MVKKLVINGTEFSFRLVSESNGLRIVATSVDGREQSVFIAQHQYDVTKNIMSLTTPTGVLRFLVESSMNEKGEKVWYVSGVPGVSTSVAQEAYDISLGLVVPSCHPIKSQSLLSPLAGRVTKLMVTVGQRVERGQVLVLIESMKMENELCAQGDAVIKTIFIATGDVVQPNQLLVEFEK